MVDILIIGAGPIGLSIAARLIDRDCSFMIFEKGSQIASSIREWGHVSLFTTWEESTDLAVKKLLANNNIELPVENTCPTGSEFVTRYLKPLATLDAIKGNLFTNAEVQSITAQNETAVAPFRIEYVQRNTPKVIDAKIVIDSSGSWGNFNSITAQDIINSKIYYGIPSIGYISKNYQNKNLAVIGNGHSAMNSILAIQENSNSKIDWIIRSEKAKFGLSKVGGRSSELEQNIADLISSENVRLINGFDTEKIEVSQDNKYLLSSINKQTVGPYDYVIANTGARPNYRILNNINIDVDSRFLTASKLANKIDPKLHSCDTVSYTFRDTIISHQNYYVVGMKSFGTASNFLLSSGYKILDEMIDHLFAKEKLL